VANKMSFQISGESNGIQTVLKDGDHTITIDEPENMGGKDSGPNPLSTLLSSLAGCENVIANMVAKEIGFDLQGIEFNVKGTLDPRGMMGDPNVKPYFENVVINAEVKTDESEERVKELQEKTDQRCPVFTTLKAAGIELEPNWSKA
jgi:putative redox protein